MEKMKMKPLTLVWLLNSSPAAIISFARISHFKWIRSEKRQTFTTRVNILNARRFFFCGKVFLFLGRTFLDSKRGQKLFDSHLELRRSSTEEEERKKRQNLKNYIE